jgi:hypothetical protein
VVLPLPEFPFGEVEPALPSPEVPSGEAVLPLVEDEPAFPLPEFEAPVVLGFADACVEPVDPVVEGAADPPAVEEGAVEEEEVLDPVADPVVLDPVADPVVLDPVVDPGVPVVETGGAAALQPEPLGGSFPSPKGALEGHVQL